MITSVNKQGITILTPDKGRWLVKGESYTDGTVYLGKADSASNWIEQDTKPPEPILLDPVDELPLVRAELDRYKRAVAEAVSINTATALKATLADAVNRLKVAVGPIAAEPIVKTP